MDNTPRTDQHAEHLLLQDLFGEDSIDPKMEPWIEFARGLERELIEARNENAFLQDALSAFEWQRINSMSQAEVEKELLDAGYTKERLDAGLAKIRATVEAAIKKRETN